MRPHVLAVWLSASALVACRAAAPEPPQARQLRDSFVQQIVSTGIVRDVQRHGDDVSFSARRGDQPDAKWRVHIDAATVEPEAGGPTKYKGEVKSSWYVNGEPIPPRGDQSDLPLAFLDNGIAQECWAFWDSTSHQWSWK